MAVSRMPGPAGGVIAVMRQVAKGQLSADEGGQQPQPRERGSGMAVRGALDRVRGQARRHRRVAAAYRGPEGGPGNVKAVNPPDGPNMLAAGAGSCCTWCALKPPSGRTLWTATGSGCCLPMLTARW